MNLAPLGPGDNEKINEHLLSPLRGKDYQDDCDH